MIGSRAVPVAADALQTDGPELVASLREAAADLAPGTTTQVTGAAGFAADVANSFAGADVRLLVVTALVVAVLDNLGKGASGAAVQNLDLMLAAMR